jgi:hypothetical protein
MEVWKTLTYAVCGVVLVSSAALTEPAKPTAGDGKMLFSDASLGRNQKSCATCHPGGKGLEGVSAKSEWKAGGTVFTSVEGAINACVKGALNGPSLSEDSYMSRSLALYLEGFKPAAAAVKTEEAAEEDDEDKFGC